MTMGLRNCPFCGRRAFVQHKGDYYRAYCSNEDCFIEPSTHWYCMKETAVARWNRRVGDDLMERMEDDGR